MIIRNLASLLFSRLLNAIILCAVISFAISFESPAVAQTFQKAIGSEFYETGTVLKTLPDGSFIIGGNTSTKNSDEFDMMLMKTDGSGNVLWTQTYGGPEREAVSDVVQTPDNGLLMLAEKYQANKTEGEALTLIKTDATGNIIWKKIQDEGGNESEGFKLLPTPDGNYVMAGMMKKLQIVSNTFFTMQGEEQSLYLLKVDGNGNKKWSKTLNITSRENIASTGIDVIAAKDGSLMVTGNVTKKGRTDKKIDKPAEEVSNEEVRNMLLMKMDQDGNVIWTKEYHGNRFLSGYSIIEKSSGGFMIAGLCTPDQTFNIDYFLMSVGENGNVEWTKTFGGAKFDAVADLVETDDGGFIVSGETKSFGHDIGDILIFKTDSKGNIQWSKTYTGQYGGFGGRMISTKSGLAITGEISMIKEGFDVLLMKVDFNGTSGCLGNDVTLNSKELFVTVGVFEKAETAPVEKGIVPPNFKRADVANIKQQSRAVRVKNLCN